MYTISWRIFNDQWFPGKSSISWRIWIYKALIIYNIHIQSSSKKLINSRSRQISQPTYIRAIHIAIIACIVKSIILLFIYPGAIYVLMHLKLSNNLSHSLQPYYDI